jgi:tetratricopeptide (TPR) repeat protein
MSSRALLASAIGTWLLLQCPHAFADPAAAEALFREGRSLLESGQINAACEKLEASNALEPSAGTLLNLATCREKQGKTATAWAQFVSAERLAQSQNRPEQALEAKRRASELEPKLSTLTLQVREAVSGLEIRRAGQAVHSASFGTPVPVDPGPLLIEVSAEGYESARLEITIAAAAERRVLEIPKLRKAAELEHTSPGTSAAGAAGTGVHADTSTALPWAIGIVGGATLVAGGVLGGLALSSNSKAIAACDKENNAAECSQTQERRDNQALASTVCVGVGLVGVGVAALWLLTGHSGRPASAWSYQSEITRDSAILKMRVGF